MYLVNEHHFSCCIFLYLHLSLSVLSTWEGLSTCAMYKNLPLLLALMCSLLLWLKMNQPLCLFAVFEVDSSKTWGVEWSQTKPTVPYAPALSPSSLSNMKHQLPHPSLLFISWYNCSLFPFVLCSVCWQWSVSLLMALSVRVCLNTKMTQLHGYCMTDATQWRECLSQGMVLHCLLKRTLG